MSLWADKFGDEYTERNTDGARYPLIRRVLDFIAPESVLEVGANRGLNLQAFAEHGRVYSLYGTEPNQVAAWHLRKIADVVTPDYADSLSFDSGLFDLVFTCGVLIHIPTDKLAKSMSEIHRVSKRWIACAEYFAPQEEMIPYRGQINALWRRDYGGLYLEQFPDLKAIDTGFLWKRTTGLDNLVYHIFEKPNA